MQSSSSPNAVAAAPVPAKAVRNQWQFVNSSEPKKNQDKDVISIVRAHAMRDVRRKQRMETVAQHKEKIKAVASQPNHAELGVTVDHSLQRNPYDWFLSGNAETDWLTALRRMLSKLESVNLDLLASTNDAGIASECDEYATSSDYWRGYDKDEIQASIRLILGTLCTGCPKSLIGKKLCDPFDAIPVSARTSYNGHVLNHCRPSFPRQHIPIWSETHQPWYSLFTDLFVPSCFDYGSQLSTH